MIRLLLLYLLLLLFSMPLFAKGVYQSNSDFLQSIFDDSIPKAEVLWLTAPIKKNVRKILGDSSGQLRIRYWRDQSKSVWILEEVGKERLITVGLVVADNKIRQLKVLAFRESRGWEVKQDFFTDQFKQIQLTPELKLNHSIDAISGATLSVRALKKLARLALYYHQVVTLKKAH